MDVGTGTEPEVGEGRGGGVSGPRFAGTVAVAVRENVLLDAERLLEAYADVIERHPGEMLAAPTDSLDARETAQKIKWELGMKEPKPI